MLPILVHCRVQHRGLSGTGIGGVLGSWFRDEVSAVWRRDMGMSTVVETRGGSEFKWKSK